MVAQAYDGNLSTTDAQARRDYIAKLPKEKKKENEINCQTEKKKIPSNNTKYTIPFI